MKCENCKAESEFLQKDYKGSMFCEECVDTCEICEYCSEFALEEDMHEVCDFDAGDVRICTSCHDEYYSMRRK